MFIVISYNLLNFSSVTSESYPICILICEFSVCCGRDIGAKLQWTRLQIYILNYSISHIFICFIGWLISKFVHHFIHVFCTPVIPFLLPAMQQITGREGALHVISYYFATKLAFLFVCLFLLYSSWVALQYGISSFDLLSEVYFTRIKYSMLFCQRFLIAANHHSLFFFLSVPRSLTYVYVSKAVFLPHVGVTFWIVCTFDSPPCQPFPIALWCLDSLLRLCFPLLCVLSPVFPPCRLL